MLWVRYVNVGCKLGQVREGTVVGELGSRVDIGKRRFIQSVQLGFGCDLAIKYVSSKLLDAVLCLVIVLFLLRSVAKGIVGPEVTLIAIRLRLDKRWAFTGTRPCDSPFPYPFLLSWGLGVRV